MGHSSRIGGVVLAVFALCCACGDDAGGGESDGGDGGRQDGGEDVGDSAVVGGADAGGHGGDAGGDGHDAAVDAGTPHDAGGEGEPDASVGPGPDVSIRFAPVDDDVVPPNGEVRFELAKGSSDARCTCVIVFGDDRQTIKNCASPIEWTDLPHGATVDARVTCTDRDTGAVGDEARRKATVDARGPSLNITSPALPIASEVCPSSTDRDERVEFETDE